MFTTRPDTLFGATYMVLAPEHPLVDRIVADEWPSDVDPRWTGGAATPAEAVAAYRAAAASKSELDRQESRDKTGVFTGGYAINPVNGQRIPVFVADYVLMGYGTGAIMAVPGQDQRDWDFAEAFGLPIVRTVHPPDGFAGQAYVGEGAAINSANDDVSLNGLGSTRRSGASPTGWPAAAPGEPMVQYKLRDWLFSRQRYWGEPFPIVYEATGDGEGLPVALPDSQLPVELPEVADYSPRTYPPDAADTEPEPPLARATEWVEHRTGPGRRPGRLPAGDEHDAAVGRLVLVLPALPGPDQRPRSSCDPEVERYWLGKDPPSTAGGPRRGRPVRRRGRARRAAPAVRPVLAQGAVRPGPGQLGGAVPPAVQPGLHPGLRLHRRARRLRAGRGGGRGAGRAGGVRFTWNGQPVRREYGKMGKSLRNVVTPDEMCERYGADTFRLYEMSTGPMEVSRPWSTRDVVGSQRFLQRVWRNLVDEQTGELRGCPTKPPTRDAPDTETLRLLHRTIAGVHADIRGAALQHRGGQADRAEQPPDQALRAWRRAGVPRALAEPLVLMLAPLTPHIAEELWSILGHTETLAYEPFPVADERYLVAETIEYPIQVNGKVRSRVTVPADADEAAVRAGGAGRREGSRPRWTAASRAR